MVTPTPFLFMARTNFTNVSAVVEIDSAITTDAVEHIDSANVLVSKMVAKAKDTDGNPFYSEVGDATQLEIIERWLAAHFYAVTDPRFASERSMTEEVKYSIGKLGMMLSATMFGQQAMILDDSGWLANLNAELTTTKGKRVYVEWLGTGDGNEPITGTASGY